MLEYVVQGCSGAGTRGNGVPTPFSRFVLKWVWSCFKMAIFWVHSHQGGRQRGGPVVPGPPFEICAPHFTFDPWLLHTSNTVFQKCGPLLGFGPSLWFLASPAAKSWRRAWFPHLFVNTTSLTWLDFQLLMGTIDWLFQWPVECIHFLYITSCIIVTLARN